MYKKVEQLETESENFELPFGGKLRMRSGRVPRPWKRTKQAEDNRWVIMAKLVPWSEVEEEYAKKFTIEIGAPAKSSRMALGALIIKEKLGVSDRETVEQIRENPYLQYFIGLKSYRNEAPFEASMLVHFRQRLEMDLVNKINRKICEENGKKAESVKKSSKALKKKRM
jgi:transposase, IS5 family